MCFKPITSYIEKRTLDIRLERPSYRYDAKGNRLQTTVAGNETLDQVYKYISKTDRVQSDGIYTYEYDLNGNLKRKYKTGEEWLYRYDLFGHLVEVKKDGTVVASYRYDHSGLRVYRTGTGDPGTRYLYSFRGALLEKHGGAAAEDRLFVYLGNRPFAEIIQRSGEETTLYLQLDHLGSVIQKTDALGQVVWGDNFTPFGSSAGEFGTDLEENGLFTGKELDPATGLYYFNARWYDPNLGRFITEDPARDGSNWYGYCSNNPLKYIDPTGLEFKATKIFIAEKNKYFINMEFSGKIYDETGQYSPEQMGILAGELGSGLESIFTGEDDKFIWSMTTDISVAKSEDDITKDDHVVRIIKHSDLQKKINGVEEALGLATINGVEIPGVFKMCFGGKVSYVSDKVVPFGKKFPSFDFFKDISGHEIGHNLGLTHYSKDSGNLMFESATGQSLNGNQINEVFNNYRWGRLNRPIQSMPDKRK